MATVDYAAYFRGQWVPFFTSTSPCVLPVTRVDRRPVGAGIPGAMVARLLGAWSDVVGVDIVKQAKHYGPLERLESPWGS